MIEQMSLELERDMPSPERLGSPVFLHISEIHMDTAGDVLVYGIRRWICNGSGLCARHLTGDGVLAGGCRNRCREEIRDRILESLSEI